MYVLGEERYGDLFPNEDKSTWLTWSKYREAMFPHLIDQQSKTEGNWTGSGGYGVGPVYVTSVNLAILHLDKGVLPIFQRLRSSQGHSPTTGAAERDYEKLSYCPAHP